MKVLLSEKIHKARKPHQCSACFRQIVAGEKYKNQFIVDSDERWSFKTCELCQYIIDEHKEIIADDDGEIWEGCIKEAGFSQEEMDNFIIRSQGHFG